MTLPLMSVVVAAFEVVIEAMVRYHQRLRPQSLILAIN